MNHTGRNLMFGAFTIVTLAVSIVFFMIYVFPVSMPDRGYIIQQSLGVLILLWAIESLIMVDYIVKRSMENPTE